MYSYSHSRYKVCPSQIFTARVVTISISANVGKNMNVKKTTQNTRTKDDKPIISSIRTTEQSMLEEILAGHLVHPVAQTIVSSDYRPDTLFLWAWKSFKGRHSTSPCHPLHCSIILMTWEIPYIHTKPPSLKTSLPTCQSPACSAAGSPTIPDVPLLNSWGYHQPVQRLLALERINSYPVCFCLQAWWECTVCHSVSRSQIKTLNRTHPGTDPWGTPPVH